MHLLATHNAKYVHMRRPCGTYTGARENPFPAHFLKAGASCPQPLRSEQHPAGLPSLHQEGEGIDLINIENANVLTDMCARNSGWCTGRDVIFTIENPPPHIRGMPSMKKLAQHDDVQKASLHACMWCSKKKKLTSHLTNVRAIKPMDVPCDNKHEHLPWGGKKTTTGWSFATAERCGYPQRMCQEIATIMAGHCRPKAGEAAPRRRGNLSKPSLATLGQRAAVGRQAKGRRLPSKVPEYTEIRDILITSVAGILTVEHITCRSGSDMVLAGTTVPNGSKILNRNTQRQRGAEGVIAGCLVKIGLPWPEGEFFRDGTARRHLFRSDPHVNDATKKAVFQFATEDWDRGKKASTAACRSGPTYRRPRPRRKHVDTATSTSELDLLSRARTSRYSKGCVNGTGIQTKTSRIFWRRLLHSWDLGRNWRFREPDSGGG